MNQNIDWKNAVNSTVNNLSSLIQLDTTNPPGNELPAVQLIRDILLENSIPEESINLIDCGSNRGNLVARLCGDGSARPLLLTGHVDVVPVEREFWSRDPFGGEVAEDCVWGRGAMDMKGTVAIIPAGIYPGIPTAATFEERFDFCSHRRRRDDISNMVRAIW